MHRTQNSEQSGTTCGTRKPAEFLDFGMLAWLQSFWAPLALGAKTPVGPPQVYICKVLILAAVVSRVERKEGKESRDGAGVGMGQE